MDLRIERFEPDSKRSFSGSLRNSWPPGAGGISSCRGPDHCFRCDLGGTVTNSWSACGASADVRGTGPGIDIVSQWSCIVGFLVSIALDIPPVPMVAAILFLCGGLVRKIYS